MQAYDFKLSKILEAEQELYPDDWISHSNLLLIRGNAARPDLTGKFLRTFDGERFLQLSEISGRHADDCLPIVPDAYINVVSDCNMRDYGDRQLRVAIHDVESIIRLCMKRKFRATNESLWKRRANILRLLFQCQEKLESGLYAILPADRAYARREYKE